MKNPEQAAALATQLAEQIRQEEVENSVEAEVKSDDDNKVEQDGDLNASATLDSVELIEQMMVGVTDQAKSILGAERCTLWLVNPKTQSMWSFLADVDGLGTTMSGEANATTQRVLRIAVGTGLAGTCAATGEVILVDDAWNDSRFDKSHDAKTGYRTKAVACVPIVKAPKRRTRTQRKMERLQGGSSFQGANAKEARVVGVMQVLNKVEGEQFDQKSVKALAKLATDAGLVLQATKLYAEIIGTYYTHRQGESH